MYRKAKESLISASGSHTLHDEIKDCVIVDSPEGCLTFYCSPLIFTISGRYYPIITRNISKNGQGNLMNHPNKLTKHRDCSIASYLLQFNCKSNVKNYYSKKKLVYPNEKRKLTFCSEIDLCFYRYEIIFVVDIHLYTNKFKHYYTMRRTLKQNFTEINFRKSKLNLRR